MYPLHFSQTETSVSRTAVYRLSREHLNWPSRASVDLVDRNVSQLLVKDLSREHHRLHGLTRGRVVHDLLSVAIEAVGSHFVRDLLDR